MCVVLVGLRLLVCAVAFGKRVLTYAEQHTTR